MAGGVVDGRPIFTGSGRFWLPRGPVTEIAGPTDEERQLLEELRQEHRIPGVSETDPLPMIGLAQLYRRDTPRPADGAGRVRPAPGVLVPLQRARAGR